jgi:hypothetical protein
MESETNDLPRQTHRLKLLVIGMSVFLMLTAFLLIGVAIMRVGGDDAAQAANFISSSLKLPAGCRVEQTIAVEERLILSIGGRDACRRIIVLDLKSGRTLGTIDFPAP